MLLGDRDRVHSGQEIHGKAGADLEDEGVPDAQDDAAAAGGDDGAVEELVVALKGGEVVPAGGFDDGFGHVAEVGAPAVEAELPTGGFGGEGF
jgi:hypothetical protein